MAELDEQIGAHLAAVRVEGKTRAMRASYANSLANVRAVVKRPILVKPPHSSREIVQLLAAENRSTRAGRCNYAPVPCVGYEVPPQDRRFLSSPRNPALDCDFPEVCLQS